MTPRASIVGVKEVYGSFAGLWRWAIRDAASRDLAARSYIFYVDEGEAIRAGEAVIALFTPRRTRKAKP